MKAFRCLVLFVPPALVVAFELAHPILTPPIYPKMLHHMPWWLNLHCVNLALFSSFGLAAYVLVKDLTSRAATLSRIAIAVFVPTYAAFDALAGIGTAILVDKARQLAPEGHPAIERLIDAYWSSATIYGLAAVGSIAWVIAMLAAAVALTSPERRRLAGVVAVVLFPVGGWARTNLFAASDGASIRPAWWVVTIGLAAAMFFVCRPRIPGALLTLSGSLFGAEHVPPTGPLGAACFLAAAAYVEVARERRRGREPVGLPASDVDHDSQTRKRGISERTPLPC